MQSFFIIFGSVAMKVLRLLFILFMLITCRQVDAQSYAYKTLLKGVYDKEFPVAYHQDLDRLNASVFLDTREKEEFEVSHIQGAQWVGFDEFDLKSIQDLDKTKPIVVYCSIGARSQAIGKKLQEAGFLQVYNLYGGIFHWVNEGLPVYSNGVMTNKVHAYNKAWGIWLSQGEKVY
jgi:rhodanese-related sulfurtransferase